MNLAPCIGAGGLSQWTTREAPQQQLLAASQANLYLRFRPKHFAVKIFIFFLYKVDEYNKINHMKNYMKIYVYKKWGKC